MPVVLVLLVFVPLCLSALLNLHIGTLSGITFTISVYLGTLGASILFYRLSPFHPLASYPGPLPARISKWWHVWAAAGGKQHLYLYRMHEKYGDVVRIGECSHSLDLHRLSYL